jgi:hypothetical protein
VKVNVGLLGFIRIGFRRREHCFKFQTGQRKRIFQASRSCRSVFRPDRQEPSENRRPPGCGFIETTRSDLEFIELSTDDILQAARDAQSLGVRGGRIHDLLHAKAALKSGATTLLTLDKNDFNGLVPGLSIEQV